MPKKKIQMFNHVIYEFFFFLNILKEIQRHQTKFDVSNWNFANELLKIYDSDIWWCRVSLKKIKTNSVDEFISVYDFKFFFS